MKKELRKLSRKELLELLLAEQEEFEELSKKLENIPDEAAIEEKYKKIYAKKLEEVEAIKSNALKKSENLLNLTKEKCRQMVVDTQNRCKKMVEEQKKNGK